VTIKELEAKVQLLLASLKCRYDTPFPMRGRWMRLKPDVRVFVVNGEEEEYKLIHGWWIDVGKREVFLTMSELSIHSLADIHDFVEGVKEACNG